MSKNKIEKNNRDQRNFSYKNGNLSLSFSLFLDSKADLENFAELLSVGKQEIEEILKSNFPQT